jgi:phosphoribosyl 1,2-cyclic phosphodiesterase
MPLRFTVLASGSSGNATYLNANGFGILLDIGLGPRDLTGRLSQAGASWDDVHAVLLTHTHTDHWNEYTLGYLCKRRIPLHCHANHSRRLVATSTAFAKLRAAKLIRHYRTATAFEIASGVCCRPLTLRHDGGATFGFRLEGTPSLFDQSWAVGYVADLGCWDKELVAALADLDVLAVEFNHDVGMERASGRAARLIARVLGDDGHLSNDQAAALIKEVVVCSTPGRLRQVVQLHLSRECNTPGLAARAAQGVFDRLGILATLNTACQDKPGPTITIGFEDCRAPNVEVCDGNRLIT